MSSVSSAASVLLAAPDQDVRPLWGCVGVVEASVKTGSTVLRGFTASSGGDERNVKLEVLMIRGQSCTRGTKWYYGIRWAKASWLAC